MRPPFSGAFRWELYRPQEGGGKYIQVGRHVGSVAGPGPGSVDQRPAAPPACWPPIQAPSADSEAFPSSDLPPAAKTPFHSPGTVPHHHAAPNIFSAILLVTPDVISSTHKLVQISPEWLPLTRYTLCAFALNEISSVLRDSYPSPANWTLALVGPGSICIGCPFFIHIKYQIVP